MASKTFDATGRHVVLKGKRVGVCRACALNTVTGNWELLVEAPDGSLKPIVLNEVSDVKLQDGAKAGYGES